MSKLSRYIIITVLSATALLTMIVACLDVLFALIAESTNLSGGYTFWHAFVYVLATLPGNLYLIFPILGLLGGLMGLGYLANHGELTAMRAAGFSVLNIAKSVILAGALMGLLTFVFGAYLAPWLTANANIQREIEKSGQAFLMTSKSTWLKEANTIVFLQSSNQNAQVTHISRYTIQNNQLTQIQDAKSATYTPDSAWTLHDVRDIDIHPNHLSFDSSPERTHIELVSPHMLNLLLNQNAAENLTLPALITYIHYRHHNELSTDRYRLFFWQLIFEPLSAIILMVMAVPFVFGPMRSGGFGYRLTAGLLLGFIFFLVSQATGPIVLVYQGSPFWGAFSPLLLFSIVLTLLIARINH